MSNSLKKALSEAKTDSTKTLILAKLAHCYTSINFDSAAYFGRMGLKLAKNIGYANGQMLCAIPLGFVLQRTNKGNEGLEVLLNAKRICEKYNNPLILVRILTNLNGSYLNKDNQLALKYIKEAKVLHEKHNIPETFNFINLNMGGTYAAVGLPDSAEKYLNRAYQLESIIAPSGYQTSTTYYLAEYYTKVKKPKQAIKYYKESIDYATKHDITYTLPRAYLGLSNLFKANNQLDSAIFYAKQSFNGGPNSPYYLTTVFNAATSLSGLYEQKNNSMQAYKYLKKASIFKDSLYNIDKSREFDRISYNEQTRLMQIQKKIELENVEYKNRLRLYLLLVVLLGLSFLAFILYRNNKEKLKTNLHLEKTLSTLKSTQAQLIQSEKLASLGELTAGIAHEIQNPLNFVNNFSEVSIELSKELSGALRQRGIESNSEEGELVSDLIQNQEKIHHHGKRASSIVKGMLEHSRNSTGGKEFTDINALVDEYLRLTYHGLRAKDKSFNSDFKTDFDESLPKIEIIPQDFGRVLLNLINNAFYATKGVKNPLVEVKTKRAKNGVVISVKDNGSGMSEVTKAKIFQPFFTTKPTGEGTGLGLSLAYDIVTKGHGGTIEVESVEGKGTTFIIKLPII
ncbi:ATP-binding protein [Lacihabitans sp. CCS-44]|uniref:ATP-binding protein n=1 Tax=Lacihabitans sp. CCS-44 TaxID=2487331 RepID=UPI0020CC3F7E|nr:ATP-binding protein [Lacihabitans sp. CCS-44]